MSTEPAWSRAISSNTVCNWFFFLAFLNAFGAVAVVITVLMALSGGKGFTYAMGMSLFAVLIGFTNAWALFLVCNRGLNTEGFGKKMKKAGAMLGNAAYFVATGQTSPF